MGSNVPSPLVYEGRMYVFRGYSSDLSCFDAETGEVHYNRQRIEGLSEVYASPIGVNGYVYVPGRNGATAILLADDKFDIVSLNRLDEVIDASPVVIGDELYLRGRKHLYSIAED